MVLNLDSLTETAMMPGLELGRNNPEIVSRYLPSPCVLFEIF